MTPDPKTVALAANAFVRAQTDADAKHRQWLDSAEYANGKYRELRAAMGLEDRE